MPARDVFFVYLFAFVVYAAVALPHTHPPYMDSFYYVDIARNIAGGQGLTEGFVWNYLAGMPPLHHPSSEYWLPGLSLVLAPAWALGGYTGCTLLMAAIAALCPALAALIGRDLFRSRRHALTMAGLTLFNGLWFHDWTTPDAFVLYAALATAALLLTYRALQGRSPGGGRLAFLGAGVLAGLAALTRQEGVLLLLAILVAAGVTATARRRLGVQGFIAAVVAYGVVQAPWLWHNVAVLGSPLAPGGSKTLWLRSYDQFFSLHAASLTLRGYLSWGAAHLLDVRIAAVLFMLAIWAALWLMVLVSPLLAGLWTLRGRKECRPFLIYWAILALAMPLLFTATLQNGTLQHASGALLPFASALVVAGIDVCGRVLARLRRGDRERLARGLGCIALVLAIVVSLGMTWRTFPTHGDEFTHDRLVVAWLHGHNRPNATVMVLDPPAFAYLDPAGRYVVAPSDGLAAARAVASRYRAAYWALDPIHAATQDVLYQMDNGANWLRYVAVVDGVKIFRVESAQAPNG